MNLPFVSVIIPTYNEEHRLPATLRAVVAYLRQHAARFEIIIADDGSTDGTRLVAAELAKKTPQIRVLPARTNRGKGASVQEGLRAARGDWLLYMDADHSTDISELKQLPGLIARGADLAVSSRYVSGSAVTTRQSWIRVAVSRMANVVIQAFAVPGIHDTQNGFKLIKKNVAHVCLPHLYLRRWAFDVELLYVVRRLGFRIIEFPVTWQNAAGSKLSIARDIRNTVGEFLRFMWNRLTGRYPRAPRRDVQPA